MEQRLVATSKQSEQPNAHTPISAYGAACTREPDSLPAFRSDPFRLGMPHLGPDGVHFGWLLREACHIHWGCIADSMKIAPSAFFDRSGARVLPSVVACTLNGEASRFREDDMC